MKIILAAVAALFLVTPTTLAESVQDMIQDAVAMYETNPDASKDALYSLATDATIPEACARWADASLAAVVLVDAGVPYPDSWAVRTLFDFTLEAIPAFRNDCILAI